MEKQKVNLYSELEFISVPGINNNNVVAQSGHFTLLRQTTNARDKPFNGTALLDVFFEDKPISPLHKITLPVKECAKLFRLCKKYGITGSTIYPDYYGAAKAAVDDYRDDPDRK